jgi:hypothetical protein
MILSRLTASLKGQNWTTIAIEFVIVVAGVFVGNWVNDWSQRQAEKREATTLILQLKPQLERLAAVEAGEKAYYRITRRYADIAFAGWAGDRQVDDRSFVIAAYQASQLAGVPFDGQSMSLALGADEVRKVDDPKLRDAIIQVMTFNYAALHADNQQSDYRKHVREVIPDPIQQAIRQSCGDRYGQDYLILPAECGVVFPTELTAHAAAALRGHPELADQLSYHLAQIDAFLSNVDRLEIRVRALLALIDKRSEGGRG